MAREFPGNPKLYKRIVIATTIGLFVWLYGGVVLVQYLWNGETALLDWKVALGAVLFALWYARFAFRWMMRADSQYGSGSGWELKERNVKLPELRG
jgi:uncharacterized membrane protein YesL